MCISWKKRIAEALLLLCLPLVVAGCGGGSDSTGGGGGGGGGTTVISGVAVKGPIAGAAVAVYRLLQTGAGGALLGSGTTGADGGYAVTIPETEAAGPLLITVTGKAGATYTSESSNNSSVPFTAAESFSAAVSSVAPGQAITVSPLTEAAFQKLPLILAAKPGASSAEKIASSIVAANAQVGAMFNVGNILAPPAGDPVYRAVLLIIDQMVEDSKVSGAITDTGAVMTLLHLAVGNVDPSAPAYQTFLTVFTGAAEKVQVNNPGVIDNIAAGIIAQLANPAAEPDFTDVTAPATVAGLSATTFAVTANTSSIVLSWSASTDDKNAVAGYDVFRDGVKIATVARPGYTDPSVTSNVAYSYTVVAFDAAGNRAGAGTALSVKPNQASLNVTINGQLSTGILDLPQNDVFAPTAPTNLSAVTAAISATNSSVTLGWTASTDAAGVTGYEVFRAGVKIATVTGTSYLDPSVASNVTATYFIIAFDAAGNRSIASNQLLVTPNQASLGVTISGQVVVGDLPAIDFTSPTAPAGLAAGTSAISGTNSSVALSWSAASDAVGVTGYEVFRNGVKVATVTSTSHTDPSVLSSVTYSYTVKAFDAAGNRSAASTALSVTPNQASLNVTVSGQVNPG